MTQHILPKAQAAFASWIMEQEASGYDAFVANAIAERTPGGESGEKLLVEGVVLGFLNYTRKGNTAMPVEKAANLVQELGLLLELPAASTERVSTYLCAFGKGCSPWPSLMGGVAERKPLVVDRYGLSSLRLWDAEAELARLLVRRSQTTKCPTTRYPHEGLSGAQQQAVQAALEHSLCLITGGAGTGKTTVVAHVLRSIVGRFGISPASIALAAPTGKAADRLRGALNARLSTSAPTFVDRELALSLPDPQTMHRLLGYSATTGRFAHGPTSRLQAECVVVDECSMVDVVMLCRLVQALRDDARLVLLGDADQLPSVDAGAAFADLCTSFSQLTVELRKNFRVDPAAKVLQKLTASSATASFPVSYLQKREDARLLRYDRPEWVEIKGDRTTLIEVLQHWTDRFFPTDVQERCQLDPDVEEGVPFRSKRIQAVLEATRKAQWLCVTRQGPHGVDAVNRWFGSRSEGRQSDLPVPLGAPVVISTNDYRRGLYNGDEGIIAYQASSQTLMTVLRQGDALVAYPYSRLSAVLELAYALTVHKAQGSEYPYVALLLPHEVHPLVTRSLLYTALSRAKRSVLIAGSLQLLKEGWSRRENRNTSLAGRVKELLAALQEPEDGFSG